MTLYRYLYIILFVFVNLFFMDMAFAVSVTWDANGTTSSQTDGSGSWLDVSKWWNGSTNVNWNSGDDAIFGNGGAGNTVTLTSSTTVNSLTLNSYTGTYSLGTTTQAITLNNGITKNVSGTGALAIISPMILTASQTWLNNSTGLLSQNATIDNGGNLLTIDGTGNTSFATVIGSVISGAGGLTKNGSGFLTMGGGQVPVHAYTGTTIINGGTVMQSNNNIPSGNITINGGILESYWATNFTRALGSGTNQIQILGGTSGFGLNGSTGASVTINNNAATEVVWGSAFFNPSTFVLQAPTAQNTSALTFSNPLDLNGSTRTIQVSGGTLGNAIANINGVLRTSTGTAGLIKTGTGRLILSAANTYNGDTTISGGILQVGNNTVGNLGNGNYAGNISIASGSTLRIWGTGNQILSGVISGGGDLTKAYGSTLTLSGNNTYTGKTSIDPQTVAGSTLSISSFNSVNGGTPLMVSSSLGAPTTIASGTIQIGNVARSSSNTLRYTGTGETTDRVLNFVFNGGARQTLDASGNGLLKFTSDMTITSSTGTIAGGITFTGTSTGEIASVIPTMPGTIQKAGNGTWTFSGTNAYANSITINAGTLALSHASNNNIASVPTITINTGSNLNTSGLSGVDDLILASGQTIAGAGTVIGNVKVASGSTLSPGTSPGTLNQTGDVTYAGGGNYIWEINNITGAQGVNWDHQNITGSLGITATSGSKFNIDVQSLTAGNISGIAPNFDKYSDYVWTIASAAGGITGFDANSFNLITTNFLNNISGSGSNGYFRIRVSGNNLQLTYTGASDDVTLTYSAGPNGSVLGNTSQIVNYGGNGTAVTAVPDTGYSFVNWSDASTQNPRTDISAINNIAVTANFQVNQYTITFDSDGGSVVPPITQDYGTVLVDPTPPTKLGYSFSGWNPALHDTMHAHDDTHVAVWTVNQYAITFDSDEGTNVDPIIDNLGATITSPANPTRIGYTFIGWNPALPITMPASSTHTHAQWDTNEYTLTFDSNGGSPVSSITQDYDTFVSIPSNPTKYRHTFTGWSPAIPVTIPATNQTYTAQWSLNQQTTTPWSVYPGTGVDLKYATNIKSSTDITKDKYVPACSSLTYPTKSIKIGVKNDSAQVMLLEKFLNQFENSKLPVDGVYSSVDQSAVKKWQEKYASEILLPWGSTKGTGYVYVNSLNKIKSIFLKQCKKTSNSKAPITETLRDLELGMSGSDVKELQKFLINAGYSIPAGTTGYFGKQTKDALILYQKANNIIPTSGYLGKTTRVKMLVK